MNHINNSALNNLIPPEIKNDEFYAAIQRIAREENIKTVLEIGSSSGGGSTEAFVTGLRENPNHPTLFCLEVSKPRFEQLQKTYQNYSFVKLYNLSSVSLEQFPSPAEIVEFYNSNHTNLNQYPLELVLDRLQQDRDYIIQSGSGSNTGINRIKSEHNIAVFDLVLIDGSEFTGKADLDEVYGSKYICLADILTYKNYKNYQKLKKDKNYILVAENHRLRNGYAIFKRLWEFANEKKEQLLVRNIVSPGMTVFDVGANIGKYSILFGELEGSAGKVYAFEPTSSTYAKLKQQIANSWLINVVPIRKAVYSQNQQIEFNEFAEEYASWNSIGKPQMVNPKNFREYVPIVGKEIVEAITLDTYCQANGIDRIDYLKIDVEGAESDALRGATKLLKKQAIRYIQFEISRKMLEGLNRTAKETFEILEQNGYACYQIKANGEIGEQVFDSNAFYENYIALPALPVHFFTIVLNGEPFIRYHIDVFQKLPFQWHWHIVEGVGELKHDTAWSLQGGRLTEELDRQGRSNDGTSEYLDELANLYPENVTVYRKPEGQFWDGKLEMMNAPLANIQEECLLWQVDVDELWTEEQICITRQMFLNQPEKTAAFYWCWYFVGENRVISTRNCYTQNPKQDWLRTWHYQPGYFWAAHEPPILVERTPEGKLQNVAALNPFSHAETENQGLVFQHFAYVTPEQLQFKERYYGYRNALAEWQNLQNQNKFPVLLREYFSWVEDDTMVDTAAACGVVPLAQKDSASGGWQFFPGETGKTQVLHEFLGFVGNFTNGAKSQSFWGRSDYDPILYQFPK